MPKMIYACDWLEGGQQTLRLCRVLEKSAVLDAASAGILCPWNQLLRGSRPPGFWRHAAFSSWQSPLLAGSETSGWNVSPGNESAGGPRSVASFGNLTDASVVLVYKSSHQPIVLTLDWNKAVLIVLLGPVFEEIVCRGYVRIFLLYLAKRTALPWRKLSEFHLGVHREHYTKV